MSFKRDIMLNLCLELVSSTIINLFCSRRTQNTHYLGFWQLLSKQPELQASSHQKVTFLPGRGRVIWHTIKTNTQTKTNKPHFSKHFCSPQMSNSHVQSNRLRMQIRAFRGHFRINEKIIPLGAE